METWVLKVSIAIPLVCLSGLVLWHLLGYVAGKRPRKQRNVRQSPEPPAPIKTAPLPPRVRAPAEVAPARDDPESLQQVCTELEDTLAKTYMELAESWLRKGQPHQAAAILKRILQIRPDKHQAQLAQARLEQIEAAKGS